MAMLLGRGGIALEHCTVTDDGVACAIEFNAVKFGPESLVPQAGVAVYERGPSGLLHAIDCRANVNQATRQRSLLIIAQPAGRRMPRQTDRNNFV